VSSVSLQGVREFFDNRNIVIIMVTQTLSMFLAWLWWPYKSLFILKLGATNEILGLLVMVETLGGMFFQIPGGVLADRYGRKRVIIASAILGFGSPLIYLFAGDWIQLVPAMLLASTASLSRGAMNALIAESLPTDKRGAGFAAISFVQKIPNVFTGIIGGVIMDHFGVIPGVRIVLTGVIGVSALSVVIYWMFLEETLLPESRKDTKLELNLGSIRELGSMPREAWVLTVVAGLSSFSVRMVFSFTVPYVINIMGLSKTEYGAISTVVSLVSMFLTLPGGVLSDRIGRKQTVVISRVIASLSTIGIPLSTSVLTLGAFRVTGSIGSGLGGTFMRVRGGPVWQALVADMTPAEGRARMMGLMGTFVSIIGTPASYVGGYLTDNVSPEAPFYVSFALNTVGTLLILLLLKPKEDT
jgi:DHA1 family tetracycline resistance protein-like MFS transporter